MPLDLRHAYFCASVLLDKGGSGRQFFRVTLSDGTGAVLCSYDASREENALYAPLLGFLRKIEFPVPEVLAAFADADGTGAVLLEDLGGEDLWTLRAAPWTERRGAYHSALRGLHRLHWTGLAVCEKSGVRLMPGFDAALYRWEREYFLENCVERHLQMALSPDDSAALEIELAALAERLLRLPRQLVHRDCQSQNILWKNGTAVFIDLQGMRAGTGFYDLGSLIYDPYVRFDPAQRIELVDFYWNLGVPEMTREAFDQALCDATAQRLMQALGAYGFLGLVKGRTSFLEHVTPALENLAAVTANNPAVPLLHALALRARAVAGMAEQQAARKGRVGAVGKFGPDGFCHEGYD